MKLLLINPPIREWSLPNVFPSGLGYLAAVLRQRNPDWEIQVYDINALRPSPEEIERAIAASDADVFGIGGLVTIYRIIKDLIQTVRRLHPDKPIMAGGSCATSVPHVMMDKTPVDYLCIGEGENTVSELLDALQGKRDPGSVNGIWRREPGGAARPTAPRAPITDLDALPFPRWDLFPMDVYCENPIGAVNLNKWDDGSIMTDDIHRRSMNVLSSRGCPYHCTFCYHDFMGVKYRFRSAENIVAEIAELKNRYNVQYIHFIDDCFIINKANVRRFCDIMVRENMGITWGCAGRVNIMTEEMLVRMKEAGCVFIGYGIESGSQTILDRIKKKVTVEQAKQAIRWTQKHLGWADASFIAGLPGETHQTIRETIDFCKELNLAPEVIFFATPYPKTALYDLAMEQGKIPDEEAHVLSLGEQGEKVRINFTDFSDAELTRLKEDMVRELGAWNKKIHEDT
jgi:radical SAM superfamily enzyme YgiQ (UPF0313 family)